MRWLLWKVASVANLFLYINITFSCWFQNRFMFFRMSTESLEKRQSMMALCGYMSLVCNNLLNFDFCCVVFFPAVFSRRTAYVTDRLVHYATWHQFLINNMLVVGWITCALPVRSGNVATTSFTKISEVAQLPCFEKSLKLVCLCLIIALFDYHWTQILCEVE